MKKRHLFTALALALAFPTIAVPANADEYLLGSQDHLRVKVYDYRPASGEAHEWTALVGEFVVSPSGVVSFPIVGDIPAAGQSTSQLARALAERLQQRVGLAQAPLASVEVMQFRPFYVVGAVDKPGEYEFRPGLTVLQAVGVAGGYQRSQDFNLIGLQRDILSSRGDSIALLREQARLKIRLARLEAQIAGAATFVPVAEPNEATDLDKIREEECLLFRTAYEARAGQRATLEKTKAFLQKEIITLQAKGETIDRQLTLGQRELAAVEGLVAKGLAVAARQISLEQNRAQLESSRLDIQLAVSRAQQDILRADRDMADLTEKKRTETLSEATETRGRLDAIAIKIKTARALTYQSELGVTNLIGLQARMRPKYSIARPGRAGKTSTIQVEDGDLVQPGDTVSVDRDLPAVTGQLGGPPLALAGQE